MTKTKDAVVITAYCMKTKQKDVVMKNITISKTSTNKYFAKGVDEHGNKLCSAIGSAKATAAIEAGVATKEGKW